MPVRWRYSYKKHQDRLDKTQIGEVLGKEPDASFVKDKNIDPEAGGEVFFVRVLHHYVYGLDFTGMAFDDAIRSFLSGFRLPGEAQKVRRVIPCMFLPFLDPFALSNGRSSRFYVSQLRLIE
jgi:brefeldin A-inhibited guanine nucleotide-exchange protein